MKTLKLTEYQAKMLWCACNLSQSQGIKFLIQYETGMLDDSEELEDWYKEAQKEYQAFRDIKNQLGWDAE